MPRRLPRPATAPLFAALLLGVTLAPVAAQDAGTPTGALTGAVTFRITLTGPVDDRDMFLVVIDCADEWCDDETTEPDMPDGKIVIFCGPSVADAPTCEAGAFEFTVDIQTGAMSYWFYRFPDYDGGPGVDQLLHNGAGQIHSGSQTSPSSTPTRAQPAPRCSRTPPSRLRDHPAGRRPPAMTKTMTFTATAQPRPRGGITIALPFDPAEAWGDRDRWYLAGTIEGYPVRATVTADDGDPEISWVRPGAAIPGSCRRRRSRSASIRKGRSSTRSTPT